MRIEIYDSFDETCFSINDWNELLAKSQSDVIFMSWEWQSTWWQVFGRGQLMICIAYLENVPVLIAPLFADGNMLFFVGSGGSDYLDFIGDVNNKDILEHTLLTASEQIIDFVGFRFYHLPANSQSSHALEYIAKKNNWQLFLENEMNAPYLDVEKYPNLLDEAINKKSLVRHENWFNKNGELKIHHASIASEIIPKLENFFNQHIKRWNVTDYPSLFNDITQKEFYKILCSKLSGTNYLRFTSIEWNGEYIAFHFGFNYKGTYLWYKPSFKIELSKQSPGEVLLKNLLQQAKDEHVKIFDFGIGDEVFKKRFANNINLIQDWGLYPSTMLNKDQP